MLSFIIVNLSLCEIKDQFVVKFIKCFKWSNMENSLINAGSHRLQLQCTMQGPRALLNISAASCNYTQNNN